MQFHRNLAFCLVVALVLLSLPAFSQSITTGEISGTVSDPSGAVIAGATVTLRSSRHRFCQRPTRTSASGTYRFPLVQPGDYVLTITSSGFQTTEMKTAVTLGSGVRLDAKLNVATSNATIEIAADATAIQTENADIQSVFDAKQIEMLPNPGNDLTYYAQLSPGAVMNSNGGYGNPFGFRVAGHLESIHAERPKR